MSNVRRLATLLATTCGAAMLGLAAAGGAAAEPAATHFTADSCSGKTNGFCLYNSNKTLSGWSPGGVPNNTLRDWAYHGSKTSIGSTIYYAIKQGNSSGANCGFLWLHSEANDGGTSGSITGNGGKRLFTDEGVVAV